MQVIALLEGLQITKEQLEATRLGKYINHLRRKTTDESLARRSKNLLRKWREMVLPVPSAAPVAATASAPAKLSTPPSVTITPTTTTKTQKQGKQAKEGSGNKVGRPRKHPLPVATTQSPIKNVSKAQRSPINGHTLKVPPMEKPHHAKSPLNRLVNPMQSSPVVVGAATGAAKFSSETHLNSDSKLSNPLDGLSKSSVSVLMPEPPPMKQTSTKNSSNSALTVFGDLGTASIRTNDYSKTMADKEKVMTANANNLRLTSQFAQLHNGSKSPNKSALSKEKASLHVNTVLDRCRSPMLDAKKSTKSPSKYANQQAFSSHDDNTIVHQLDMQTHSNGHEPNLFGSMSMLLDSNSNSSNWIGVDAISNSVSENLTEKCNSDTNRKHKRHKKEKKRKKGADNNVTTAATVESEPLLELPDSFSSSSLSMFNSTNNSILPPTSGTLVPGTKLTSPSINVNAIKPADLTFSGKFTKTDETIINLDSSSCSNSPNYLFNSEHTKSPALSSAVMSRSSSPTVVGMILANGTEPTTNFNVVDDESASIPNQNLTRSQPFVSVNNGESLSQVSVFAFFCPMECTLWTVHELKNAQRYIQVDDATHTVYMAILFPSLLYFLLEYVNALDNFKNNRITNTGCDCNVASRTIS